MTNEQNSIKNGYRAHRVSRCRITITQKSTHGHVWVIKMILLCI